MTKTELATINKMHDRLDQLEHQGLFLDADDFFYRNRWAFDYDRKGNWVGEVANENGWTP